MRWEDRRESDHVEDRREQSGGGRGLPSMGTMMMLWPLIKPLLRSKFGLMILAVGALAWFSGFNPLSLIGMGGYGSSSHLSKAEEEKEAKFIKTVLADTEEVWSSVLPKYGIQYTKPTLVLDDRSIEYPECIPARSAARLPLRRWPTAETCSADSAVATSGIVPSSTPRRKPTMSRSPITDAFASVRNTIHSPSTLHSPW